MIDILKNVGSLQGANATPIPGQYFRATVAVPVKFFADDDPLDALERFFDSGEDPSVPCRAVTFEGVS